MIITIFGIISLLNRHRSIAIGSFASVFARGIQIISVLIMTGIATRSFSNEEFGLWAILISFLYSGYAFDFGYRSAMTNRLTAMVADSSGEPNLHQKEFYLSIFYLQIGIGILGAIFVIFLGNYISWGIMLKIHQPDILKYINQLVIVIFILIFLNVPLLSSSGGFFAFHEVHFDSYLQALQSLVLLGGFWFVNVYKILSFKNVVIVYFLVFLLFGLIKTVVLFKHRTWNIVWVPFNRLLNNIKSISSVSFDFFFIEYVKLNYFDRKYFLSRLNWGPKKCG